MKKIFQRFFVALLITTCLVVTTFAGCSKPTTVYLDGGVLTTLSEDTELEELVASRPTKEGMEFAGWYSDPAFADYIVPSGITEAQKKKNTAYAKWIVVKEMQEYAIRSEEATISDSGRENQKMDRIPISSDFNVIDLVRAGYHSIEITLTLDIREIDDGYQYIFFYSNTSCARSASIGNFVEKYLLGTDPEDPSLITAYEHEHGPGAKYVEWETLSFGVTIDLNRLTNDVYLRYGADGSGADKWINKNITAVVVPIK